MTLRTYIKNLREAADVLERLLGFNIGNVNETPEVAANIRKTYKKKKKFKMSKKARMKISRARKAYYARLRAENK